MIILVCFALNIHHFWGIFGAQLAESQAEIWLKLDRLQELIDETGQQASILESDFLDLFGVGKLPTMLGGGKTPRFRWYLSKGSAEKALFFFGYFAFFGLTKT